MILNDIQIAELCEASAVLQDFPMIEPFQKESIRECKDSGRSLLSFGLSSHGYDVRLASDIKVFHTMHAGLVDPKVYEPERFLMDAVIATDEAGNEYTILPPNSYILGRTVEYFRIPRDVQCFCLGKSTYARCGVLINATPINAGFTGQVVIEIANGTPLPVKIYINEGIAQFFFLKGEECAMSYGDRGGLYQGQEGVTLPKV